MKLDIDQYIDTTSGYEFPPFLIKEFYKVKRLEWITVSYIITVVVLMFLSMGSSQAMKAAWVEDMLSIIPSTVFLIASRYYNKTPNKNFPYGFHKAYTVAFVAGSLALLILGLFILIDSAISLIMLEHPTIGSLNIFGKEVWLGWVMIVVLIYSFLPSVILGLKKLPFAKDLHIKVLFVDSEAQKADWMTALAAIIGIVGVGFGLWWIDSVAAIFISISIVIDGFKRSRDGMKDLLEEIPYTYDNKRKHPVLIEIVELTLKQPWVKDMRLRMREHGMVFFGEIFIIPNTEENLINNIQDLFIKVKSLNWIIEDIVIYPVHRFPNPNVLYDEIPDDEKERLHKRSKAEL